MLAILRYFTENPWPLVLLLAFVEVMLLVAIKWRGQGALLKLALAVPVAAVALVVAEWVIVTEPEELKSEIQGAARALQNEDIEAFLSHFSPAYEFEGLTYETISQWARSFIGTYKLHTVSFFWDDDRIQITDGQASVVFSVLTTGQLHGVEYGLNKSTWQVDFQREGTDQRWKVTKVRPVHIPGLDARSLLGVLRARVGL